MDSSSGTITRSYDGLDNLTDEQGPQGQASYSYYPNSLRETMAVQGQAEVSYSYDNGNRLTQITQGSAAVAVSYDSADRRTNVTLPNGVRMQYSYDNASDLTGITYQNGGTTLGNLTYSYDADGRRVGEGGSLSQVNLPSAVPSASYDVANELTSWGSLGLSYDADGNLTNSGTSTYTWNERNELTAASDGSSSFAYDTLGRRISATVSGSTTSYAYDGSNPVLANSNFMLAGLGLDEYYAQVSSSGTLSMLSDALGSTIATTDTTGAIATSYGYEPYGATTQSGNSGTPFQFTGRENDGASNLYFFRARYYSPELGRFISRDPSGLLGGPNAYAYVGDDPINNIDPLGLWSISIGGYLGAGAVFTFGSDNGSSFFTMNVGLGAGLDVSYNPDGGVPGGAPAVSSDNMNLGNGIVVSDEADADVEVGPVDVGGAIGAYRNYGTEDSGWYAGPGASGTVHWGIDAGVTVNAQVSLYNPYKPPQPQSIGCE